MVQYNYYEKDTGIYSTLKLDNFNIRNNKSIKGRNR